MPALTRSIYLALSKSKVTKEISFHAELDKAKTLLVRLAEKPPYTLFSLFTAAALKRTRSRIKITIVYPASAEPLLSVFNNFFDARISLPETPNYGSKSFKSLKEQFAGKQFDLFVDLDTTPLPELTILSSAKLRMTYEKAGLLPYFNILFTCPQETNLLNRAQLMARYLGCEDDVENMMPAPKINQREAAEWLKKQGVGIITGKRSPFLLTPTAVEREVIAGMRVFKPDSWQNENFAMQAALFNFASAYLGGPDRGFELAYLMKTPSILLIPEHEKEPALPPTPLVASVIKTFKGTLPFEAIERVIKGILV